jgi:hypothetical protein
MSQTQSTVWPRISNVSSAVIIAKPAGGVVRDEEVMHMGSKAIGIRPIGRR